MDPIYESEEMETNLESMFEHVNQMANTDMPRDFLASLSKHFFRENGEKFTTFQKFQTEACLLLEQKRPHWRKRKAKSASQFLSMFYLLEKEVMESGDQVAMSLFVEAFNSREAYIESVMAEFDETDELEKKMSSGPTIKVPGFVYDDDDDDDADANTESHVFDLNNCVLEVCNIIEDLDDVTKTKYVKVFDKDNDISIGIHNARVKALAKRKDVSLTPFPSVKFYPAEVKSATKTFTKLTSTSSTGAANTSAGYCMLINIKHMNEEAKSTILGIFGRDDVIDDQVTVEEHDEDDLLPSQDFPNLFQSQTSETLLHCTLCEYLSRSKVEFEEHELTHPNCPNCRKQFINEIMLNEHMEMSHPATVILCDKCSKEFSSEVELRHHMKEHEIFSSYKKALEKNHSTPRPKSKSAPIVVPNAVKKKKVMNCYLVFVDEHKAKAKEDNPSMTPNQITKLLTQTWNSLTKDEQKVYKTKATEMNSTEEVLCPKCGGTFVSNTELIKHLMTDHIEATTSSGTQASASTSSVANNQSTLQKCNVCGKLFYTIDKLNDHKATTHNIQVKNSEVAQNMAESEEADKEGNVHSEDVDEETNVHPPEDPATSLVWVKLANQPWPAKMISNVDGEISEVELFDEEGTRKMIEHIKLKPFSKLDKIPKRSNLWKAAYEKALQCLGM